MPSHHPIRVMLVEAATGLCAPIFATGGVVLAWFRLIPRSLPWQRWPFILSLGGGLGTLT